MAVMKNGIVNISINRFRRVRAHAHTLQFSIFAFTTFTDSLISL